MGKDIGFFWRRARRFPRLKKERLVAVLSGRSYVDSGRKRTERKGEFELARRKENIPNLRLERSSADTCEFGNSGVYFVNHVLEFKVRVIGRQTELQDESVDLGNDEDQVGRLNAVNSEEMIQVTLQALGGAHGCVNHHEDTVTHPSGHVGLVPEVHVTRSVHHVYQVTFPTRIG